MFLADGVVIVQAQTIELLCKKGNFSTEQAVTLAEAIDMGIEKAQLVTVPIMDARFALVDARFVEVNAKIDSKFATLDAKIDGKFSTLDAKIDRNFVTLDAKIDSNFAAVNAKVDSNFETLSGRIDANFKTLTAQIDGNSTSVNARMDSLQARIELKMQRWAVLMILVMLAGQTALGPIGMEAFSSLKQALSTLVR